MHVGWDFASATHDVTVLDDAGHVVDRWSLRHDERGIVETLTRLRRHGTSDALPVAIETTTGVVVGRLLEAGHPVVPIHPNAFAGARSRWGAAKAKSDPGDSYKLADYLRTDGHRLRRLAPLDAATRHLQALSRVRDDHVAAKVAATNQLAALLALHWPGAADVFGRLDSAIALDFLDRYPTPQSAARLGEARMAAFCQRHSYCGRRTPAELLDRLRRAPTPVVTLDAEVLAELVRAQARLLRTLLDTLGDLDRALAAALPEHPKTALLETLPRVGRISLAQVLAEVGPILDRAVDAEHAAAEAGAAPVTRASGKHHAVCFRWAANLRARKALVLWADNSRHASPWAAQLYRAARRRGKRHPAAVRIVARAWIRVLYACWHSGIPYSSARHAAEQRLAAA
jgi:transposase